MTKRLVTHSDSQRLIVTWAAPPQNSIIWGIDKMSSKITVRPVTPVKEIIIFWEAMLRHNRFIMELSVQSLISDTIYHLKGGRSDKDSNPAV